MAKKEKRYDVIVYNIDTYVVAAVVGINMRLKGTHNSAERRLQTMMTRIGDDYSPAIVETGKYKEGDLYKAERLA